MTSDGPELFFTVQMRDPISGCHNKTHIACTCIKGEAAKAIMDSMKKSAGALWAIETIKRFSGDKWDVKKAYEFLGRKEPEMGYEMGSDLFTEIAEKAISIYDEESAKGGGQ